MNREEPAGLGGPNCELYILDSRGALVERRAVVSRDRLILTHCLILSVLIVRAIEDMCLRYPNATAVNVYGAGAQAIHSLAVKEIYSLRNLEALTLGRGQLGETFFQVLPECHMLKSLAINDATLGNGIQEIPIYHERLRRLQLLSGYISHATCNAKLPTLPNLDIAACHKLSDAAIRSAATSCPLLASLDMSNCSCASDETLREISLTCVNLHVLDASYCPNISLESVRLTTLKVLKLHNFSFNGCHSFQLYIREAGAAKARMHNHLTTKARLYRIVEAVRICFLYFSSL
nr:F-box/LRR-repeat protein 15 [Ipomoea batatas]